VDQVYVDATVAAPGPAGERIPVNLLVDSGAQYTVLPYEIWHRLGLIPKRGLKFVLADGSHMERTLSECHIQLPQGDGHTPVVLGKPGDLALLGVITLEALGFVLNPFDRSIRPMESAMLAVVA
jgi:predicted aspartyl protease